MVPGSLLGFPFRPVRNTRERMAILDLHLQFLVVSVRDIRADAADQIFIVDRLQIRHHHLLWHRARLHSQDSYARCAIVVSLMEGPERWESPRCLLQQTCKEFVIWNEHFEFISLPDFRPFPISALRRGGAPISERPTSRSVIPALPQSVVLAARSRHVLPVAVPDDMHLRITVGDPPGINR